MILYLNPGKVGEVAEVFINGQNAGITWMRSQDINITGLVKKGKNE